MSGRDRTLTARPVEEQVLSPASYMGLPSMQQMVWESVQVESVVREAVQEETHDARVRLKRLRRSSAM